MCASKIPTISEAEKLGSKLFNFSLERSFPFAADRLARPGGMS